MWSMEDLPNDPSNIYLADTRCGSRLPPQESVAKAEWKQVWDAVGTLYSQKELGDSIRRSSMPYTLSSTAVEDDKVDEDC